MRVARRRFDAEAGGDAGDHHLGDAERLQVRLGIRAGERARSPLGDRVILRLPVQFGNEVGPVRGQRGQLAGLLCAPQRHADDSDEHDRQIAAAKGLRQFAAFATTWSIG